MDLSKAIREKSIDDETASPRQKNESTRKHKLDLYQARHRSRLSNNRDEPLNPLCTELSVEEEN